MNRHTATERLRSGQAAVWIAVAVVILSTFLIIVTANLRERAVQPPQAITEQPVPEGIRVLEPIAGGEKVEAGAGPDEGEVETHKPVAEVPEEAEAVTVLPRAGSAEAESERDASRQAQRMVSAVAQRREELEQNAAETAGQVAQEVSRPVLEPEVRLLEVPVVVAPQGGEAISSGVVQQARQSLETLGQRRRRLEQASTFSRRTGAAFLPALAVPNESGLVGQPASRSQNAESSAGPALMEIVRRQLIDAEAQRRLSLFKAAVSAGVNTENLRRSYEQTRQFLEASYSRQKIVWSAIQPELERLEEDLASSHDVG